MTEVLKSKRIYSSREYSARANMPLYDRLATDTVASAFARQSPPPRNTCKLPRSLVVRLEVVDLLISAHGLVLLVFDYVRYFGVVEVYPCVLGDEE